jgi:hypothetical protein
VNYTPSILPSDLKDLLAYLNRELQQIASAIAEKSNRLWYLSSILTPAQITGNTNDYAPPGIEGALWLRLSASAPFNITGFKNPEAGSPRLLIVSNITAATITLVHASGSSAAAARLNLPGAANRALTQNSGMIIGYDPSTLVWRSLADAV